MNRREALVHFYAIVPSRQIAQNKYRKFANNCLFFASQSRVLVLQISVKNKELKYAVKRALALLISEIIAIQIKAHF